MTGENWKTAAIVLLAVALGVLLGGSRLTNRAHAQSEGSSGGLIAVMGEVAGNDAPLILVDVPDQTIMVYEYSYSGDTIELTSARTYRWDKRLTDYETDGPSVDEVRAFVEESGTQQDSRTRSRRW
ncbi:MAG: hypothetical protein R6X33_07750 [Candidatus Brocadiia bacterium]